MLAGNGCSRVEIGFIASEILSWQDAAEVRAHVAECDAMLAALIGGQSRVSPGVRMARTSNLTDWSSDPPVPLGDIGRSGIFTTSQAVYVAYPRWCSVDRIGDSVDVISSTDGQSWRWLMSPRSPRGTGITDAVGVAVGDRIYVAWREYACGDQPVHEVYV